MFLSSNLQLQCRTVQQSFRIRAKKHNVMIFHFLGCKIHRDLFFISHVLVWVNVLCFFFASTGWEQRVMFFFRVRCQLKCLKLTRLVFFFEHGKWAEIHVYLFFILARLRRAKFPFSACISTLARLRRAKFSNFLCFLPWCACSMPYSWVLSPFFALAHRWHALTCMFFSRLFGAPAAVDVLCFFFRAAGQN